MIRIELSILAIFVEKWGIKSASGRWHKKIMNQALVKTGVDVGVEHWGNVRLPEL